MSRVAATMTMVLLAMCGSAAESPVPPRASPQSAAIPASRPGPAYEITDDVNIQHAWTHRFVGVRLKSKVTEAALTAIAREIRSAEPWQYKTTEIDFFAPRQVSDGRDDCWAIVTFRPEIAVEMIGLTLEREAEFLSVPRPSGPEVVGTWLVENIRYAQLVTIFKSGEKAWLEERTEPSGPSRSVKLDEVAASNGRHFASPGSRIGYKVVPGEVYEVALDGILRIRFDKKLCSSSRPLR